MVIVLYAVVAGLITAGILGVTDVVHFFSHDDIPRWLLALAGAIVVSCTYATVLFAHASPPVQRAADAPNVLLATRSEVDQAVGVVDGRLAAAGRGMTVLISGTDCAFIRGPATPAVEAALRRGVNFRVLCVDPGLPKTVLDAIPDLDPRFADVETFRTEARETTRVLQAMRDRGFERDLELRYFRLIPALHFFVVDPDHLSGSFKVESYAPSHDARSNTRDEMLRSRGRPHWILPEAATDWRRHMLVVWDFYWANGKHAVRARGPQ